MDFFDQQDAARRASRWLLLWYALAVVFVVACFNLAVALVYAVFALYGCPAARRRRAAGWLVRAVAATLDCPLPPVIGALDPATLAA